MDSELSRRSFTYLPLLDSPGLPAKPRSQSLTLNISAYSTGLPDEETVKLCLICEETVGTVGVEECGHMYCEDCFRGYVEEETKVKGMVRCPKFNCGNEVGEGLLERFMDEASFYRYLRLQRDSALESNPDFRWCPKPHCKGFALKPPSSATLTCSVCSHAFCFFCGEPPHAASRCRAKADRSLRAWAKRHNAKFCPNCKVLVQRGAGCSHMSCVRCGHEWCWLCGLPLSGHQHCQVQQYWLWNPPVYICIALLGFPAVLPFVFVILMLIVAKNEFGNSFDDWKERSPCSFYISLVSLTLLCTPLLFLLVALGSVLVLCDIIHLGSGSNQRTFCYCLFSTLLSISASPLVVALIALIAALAPVLGVVYIVFKLYICQRRLRGDASYMVPTGVPGYPLG